MTYEEARNYLDQASKKGIILGLTVMEELLKRMGDPQKELKIVHIAGTNGKGSILAFLEQIFIDAGYRTGRYVSPVIGAYEERFLLSSVPVEKEKIPPLTSKVKEAALKLEQETGLKPTVFEIETAMAFQCFYEEQTDVVLLETGMGGRLDATNVIESPLLSIIASVSEDHIPVLGTNLREIAGEKAGIMKEGCPVLLYPDNPSEVIEVIEEECKKRNSELIRVQKEDIYIIEETPDSSRFSYGALKEMKTYLPGRHQVYNASAALKAAEILEREYPLLTDSRHKKNGIKNTRWKGRLEKICDRPLTYLDGAHNPDGAGKLADFIKEHFTGRRILAVTGVLADKEYEKIMSRVLPLVHKTVVFTPNNKRGLLGEELLKTAQRFCRDCIVKREIKEALSWAVNDAAEDDVIVVFGSLSFICELGEYDETVSENYRA